MKNNEAVRAKNVWKIILKFTILTAVICSGIWGYFYARMIDLKNERIALLEQQNKQLLEFGPVPKAVEELRTDLKDLESKLTPLLLAIPLDPLTGRASFGEGLSGPTKLTIMVNEALKLIEEKKYDLALKKAEEMENIYADFPGIIYVRFLVNKKKNYKNEMIIYGTTLLEKLPNDKRLLPVYVDVVNLYLEKGKKKSAEDYALKAMQLAPEDKALKESFKEIFGYISSLSGSQIAPVNHSK